ncbi:MAG: sigma-70 family RNA polymerase sigma factor [Oscillibacter sp.]|nr:sigma-70 family RNA polymerase sigma factor [Oscillibacter sp.]
MSDAELKFLEELYRTHYQKLFLYANAVVKHREVAEEAVQDTFHIACLKIAQLRASPNSAGWLVQTLKNVLRNMERTRSSLYSSLQRDLPYEERYVGSRRDEENISLLYGDTLTEEELSLLQRIAVEGCTYLEASRELGISAEACRKRMQRIRDKLRKNLTH